METRNNPHDDAADDTTLAQVSGLDNDTRWSSIAVALRAGQDHTPFLPSEATVAAGYVKQVLRFVERARTEKNQLAAESELIGVSPQMRGHAYSMATVVLGDATPEAWRAAAKKLLFAGERPYFK